MDDLKLWKCHKTVHAAKILSVKEEDDGNVTLALDNDTSKTLNAHYRLKHQPKAGGYFVVYADGYYSFSPAEAFEDGYTEVE